MLVMCITGEPTLAGAMESISVAAVFLRPETGHLRPDF